MSTILVTGGAGYIGSHTVLELFKSGYEVIVLDNLERGYSEALKRVEQLAGKTIPFEKADLRQPADIASVFQKHPRIDAVMHFAAYKRVGEADKDPGMYYFNNIFGSYNLLQQMKVAGVNKIIFSGTAAAYGNATQLPLTESSPIQPLNAYGHSKVAIEWMLDDYFKAYGINSTTLRYFNAAGADESGKIGEDPALSTNVIPMILQTLIGSRDKFLLFGNQFPTTDGTQERDYIHVTDLATAHVAALKKLDRDSGSFVYNLGTGKPTSVKQLIEITEKISGKKLTLEVVEPRPGDPFVLYCDPAKANQELNWKAKYDVEKIVADQWNWVVQNPHGFS